MSSSHSQMSREWRPIPDAREHVAPGTTTQLDAVRSSNIGNSAPQIAAMWITDETHVRRVIHDFNERGMASLEPEYGGGRPRRITDEDSREAVTVAGARPDNADCPKGRQ